MVVPSTPVPGTIFPKPPTRSKSTRQFRARSWDGVTQRQVSSLAISRDCSRHRVLPPLILSAVLDPYETRVSSMPRSDEIEMKPRSVVSSSNYCTRRPTIPDLAGTPKDGPYSSVKIAFRSTCLAGCFLPMDARACDRRMVAHDFAANFRGDDYVAFGESG